MLQIFQTLPPREAYVHRLAFHAPLLRNGVALLYALTDVHVYIRVYMHV